MSTSFDVDIAHIRARTLISLVLASGAVLQTVGGGLLLHAGLDPKNIPTLKIMGADVSTATLGAIALCTSALWAYLAYLARPQGAHVDAPKPATTRREGSIEINDFSLTGPQADVTRASPSPST